MINYYPSPIWPPTIELPSDGGSKGSVIITKPMEDLMDRTEYIFANLKRYAVVAYNKDSLNTFESITSVEQTGFKDCGAFLTWIWCATGDYLEIDFACTANASTSTTDVTPANFTLRVDGPNVQNLCNPAFGEQARFYDLPRPSVADSVFDMLKAGTSVHLYGWVGPMTEEGWHEVHVLAQSATYLKKFWLHSPWHCIAKQWSKEVSAP